MPTKLASRASLVGASVAALSGAAITAHADAEVGITAGIHQFSQNNELGVPDSDSSDSLSNAFVGGLRLGWYPVSLIGLEIEGMIIPTSARKGDSDVLAAEYRAHIIVQMRADNEENHVLPFVLFGGGFMSTLSSSDQNDIASDTDAYSYVGVGLKYRFKPDGWGIRGDIRMQFPPSSKDHGTTNDEEYLLSIYKTFGHHAPKKAEPPPPPPPPPPPAEVKDTDGDGIKDDVDKCPNDPEDKDGFQDADGCPDPDNDGDGVPDAADKCPNEAGPKENDGCPDKDTDGDGIVDRLDKCPTEPETVNGYQDQDGCPDEVPKAIAKFTGTIKGINFKSGSDELLASSNKTLDEAVKVLADFPTLKLEIQGHTDNAKIGKGSKFADNTALSQARAESVKAYFVKKGIGEDRLIAKGYGETVPLADNKTAAGKAQNRRVEFKLVTGN